MHSGNVSETSYRQRRRSGHHILQRSSGKHKFRQQQRIELGGHRCDEHRHHTGNIHLRGRKRFNDRRPNGDHHLHTNGDECDRLCQIHANRNRECRRKQTYHQLVHREPGEHQLGFEQHIELGHNTGNEYCHHSWNFHVHISERLNEREPNGDDHIHTDGYQRRRLKYGQCNCHDRGVRRATIDHDYFMPERNTGCGIRGLHDRCNGWRAALRVHGQHECQLSSTP
jgi:hypothetical protein